MKRSFRRRVEFRRSFSRDGLAPKMKNAMTMLRTNKSRTLLVTASQRNDLTIMVVNFIPTAVAAAAIG